MGIILLEEQLVYAWHCIEWVGLSDWVELWLQDYCDFDQQYDHIVLIEMFEAVGEEWWLMYFVKVNQCLCFGGRVVFQVIIIDEQAFMWYWDNFDFIQLYIFPGGMLSFVFCFCELAAIVGLQLKEDVFFGEDYVIMLCWWFEEVWWLVGIIEVLGYSEFFLCMWRYYLVYCEVGFCSGCVDLMQIIFERLF